MKVSVGSCVLLVATIIWLSPVPCVSQALTTSWQSVNIGGELGFTGVLAADVDGDGTDEIIIGSGHVVTVGNRLPQNSHFHVMKAADERYETIWTSPFYSEPALRQLATMPHPDGRQLVFALFGDGTVEVFSGPDMQRVHRWQTRANEASALTTGDLGGHTPFLVAIGSDYLAGIDPLTGEDVLYRGEFGGDDVAIGDVTGDGRNEIVITKAQSHNVLGNAYVLDGWTGQVLWHYPGGFGARLALSDINGNGRMEIMAHGPDETVRVFDATVRSPIVEFETTTPWPHLRPILAADLENDGNVQFVVGRGGLSIYDPATGNLLWSSGHPSAPGHVAGIVVAKMNGAASRLVYADGSAMGVIEVENRVHLWANHFSGDRPLFTPAFGEDGVAHDLIVFDADPNANRRVLRRLDLGTRRYTHEKPIQSSWSAHPAIASGRLEAFNQPLIVAWAGLGPVFYDQHSLEPLGSVYINDAPENPAIGDVFGDGRDHLMISSAGSLNIYDGKTFEPLRSYPRGSHNINVDHHVFDDPVSGRRLLLVSNWLNRPTLVDVESGEQVWTDESINGASSFTAGDVFGDGKYHIVVGTASGRVVAVNLESFSVQDLLTTEGLDITGLSLAHIDASGRRKLLIATDRLRVYDASTDSIEWESERLGYSAGRHGYFFVGDLQNNGIVDVVLSTLHSVHHFTGTEPYFVPDFPFVLETTPAAGADRVALDASIFVPFSKPMSEATLSSETISVQHANEDLVFAFSYDPARYRLEIEPQPLWPADARIMVRISGSIEDAAGKMLDGNRNEIAEGSPIDDYVWTFSTGDGLDTRGPVVQSVQGVPDTVWWDSLLELHVSVSDTGSARSRITHVEAFVEGADTVFTLNITPLDPGGTQVEAVGAVDLLGVEPGDYTIIIRAQDQSGNAGEPVARSFSIAAPFRSNLTAEAGGLERHNYQRDEGLLPPLSLLWERGDSYLFTAPAVVNGTIYGAVSRGYERSVEAISLGTGETIWEIHQGPHAHVGAMSFAYGYIYFWSSSEAGIHLHAVDASSGSIRWRSFVTQSQNVNPVVTVADRRVYFMLEGELLAYDAADGSRLWSSKMPVNGTPVIYGDLLVSVQDALFVGVDLRDGTVAWRVQLPAPVPGEVQFTLPVLDADRGRVYYATQGNLYALDLASRTAAWSRPGSYYSSNLSFDGSSLYILDSGALTKIDAENGEVTFRSGSYYSGFLTGTRSTFITQTNNTTDLIDRRSGRQLAQLDKLGRTIFANRRLLVIDHSGNLYAYAGEIETNVTGERPPVAAAELYPNYPNPFNPSTTIRYATSDDGDVRLTVFNALGRRVATLQDGFQSAGSYTVTWDAGEMASGVYFCRLEAGGRTVSARMVLVK